MPHEREKHGGVLRDIGYPRALVHRGRAGEQIVDLESLQRRRQQADRTHYGSAAADPIPHRKPCEPAVLLRVFIQFTAGSGDRDRVFAEIQSALLEFRFRFQHAVAGLFCAAGFGDNDHERLSYFIADLVEHAIETVRIGVIEKRDVHRIVG